MNVAPVESHPAPTTLPEVSLDDLLTKDTRELRALYVAAEAPRLEELDGFLAGRFLAGPLGHRALPPAVRAYAKSKLFPWRGKVFRPTDAQHGTGVNVWLRRTELFRFRTSIATSRAGGFDALHLDYDVEGNPLILRPVRDELRRIRPGLWLGQMYYPLLGRAKLVMYFAVGA